MITHTIISPAQTVILDTPGDHLVQLIQPHASVTIRGAFATQDSDHTQLNLTIHHQAPRTHAQTILKGVARDCSQLTLKGKIVIDENCPETKSFLEERILLLSDTARAEAIPELEISTDDVSCSHAASVTNIPQEQIFYLQSRGMSEQTAKDMIVESFLEM